MKAHQRSLEPRASFHRGGRGEDQHRSARKTMSNWRAFSPLDERPFSGRPSLFARARMLKGVTYADSPLARLTLQGSGEHSVKGVDNRTSSSHPPPLPVPLPSHNTVEKKKKNITRLFKRSRKKKNIPHTERRIISSKFSSKFNFDSSFKLGQIQLLRQ